jgi:hypothetical protein
MGLEVQDLPWSAERNSLEGTIWFIGHRLTHTVAPCSVTPQAWDLVVPARSVAARAESTRQVRQSSEIDQRCPSAAAHPDP